MAWVYFGILIAYIALMFIILKRPMYEVMISAFVLMVLITGQIGSIGTYIYGISKNYLLFTIIMFIAFSVVLDRTGVIYDLIDIITALVGRFSGGAGYVALLASTMMGALCGTGPGNAAAIGCVAIPSMKKSGFSAELAAVVEMSASCLGPVIPPSGSIPIVFGIFATMYPDACTFSQFWLMMWGLSAWFVLQRLISLFIDIKRMHIGPVPKEDRMPLGEAMKKGWKSLLLPVLVLLPFILDAQFNATFFTERLGAVGAKALSSSLLCMVPSICVAYVLFFCFKKGSRLSVKQFGNLFGDAIHQISPVIGMVFGGFGLSELFNDIGIAAQLTESVAGMGIPYWVFAFIVPLICIFFGMFLESTTMLYMFTMPIVSIAAAVGFNPMICTGMIIVMTTAVGHMTPPFGQTFFVSMGLAKSDFMKTTKMVLPWVAAHYVFTVLVLYKILPVWGAVDFPF